MTGWTLSTTGTTNCMKHFVFVRFTPFQNTESGQEASWIIYTYAAVRKGGRHSRQVLKWEKTPDTLLSQNWARFRGQYEFIGRECSSAAGHRILCRVHLETLNGLLTVRLPCFSPRLADKEKNKTASSVDKEMHEQAAVWNAKCFYVGVQRRRRRRRRS